MSAYQGMPGGWTSTALTQVALLLNGDRGKNYPSKDLQLSEGVPFVNAGHLHAGRINFAEMNYISEERFALLAGGKIEPNDILYCLRGSLGKAALVGGTEKGAIASSLLIVRPLCKSMSRYLYYFLVSPLGAHFIQKYDNGTAQPNLSARNVGNYEVPVAPEVEQARIVRAMESYFTRLDDAVATLERIERNLKRYRASVLKAAVEGRLVPTEAALARQARRDFEPASVLLERILTERRRSWSESGKKGKYEEPKALDTGQGTGGPLLGTSSLPGLPPGWCWATVDQLASPEPRSIQSGPFGSSLRHSEFRAAGKLVVGIDNVQDGYFSMGAEHRISDEKYKLLQRFSARAGDVLVTVMATIGRTCVIPDDLETAIITKHVYRITPNRSLILPRYLHLCLWGAPAVREQMFGQVQGQTRPGLNGSIIKRLTIPVPPLAEQGRILEETDRLLSMVTATQSATVQTERRLSRLRQSVLKWAFEGKLVDQDANDEPASALLERIKRARSADTFSSTNGLAREIPKKRARA